MARREWEQCVAECVRDVLSGSESGFQDAIRSCDMDQAFAIWNRDACEIMASACRKAGAQACSAQMNHGLNKFACESKAQKPIVVRHEDGEISIAAKGAAHVVKQCNRVRYVCDGVKIAKSSDVDAWAATFREAWQAAIRQDGGELT
eukprot:7316604-Alexandrium_andersonii.AAC.1